MLLREVEYARPETIDEAVRLLSSREDARALAGGQSLVNVMKIRVAAPELVVDLNRIRELREIKREPDGAVQLGAMVTYDELIRSDAVRAARPILGEVALTIADVQVRNRGTVGGNLCVNDPTNHLPPLMATTGATMTIRSLEAERTVSSDEFFQGVYLTAVAPGEMLTRVTVPALAPGRGDGWASVTLGREGTGIVNAAATVTDGRARIAVGCVAAVPVVVEAEAEEVSVRKAVADADLDPPGDVHASADFRRHLAQVLAWRAVAQALERIGA
jgi:aerobic carbon-monoxide dehydrogenase medium subunit